MSSISLSLASYAEDASVPLLADMEKKEVDGYTSQLWPSVTSLLPSLSSTGVEYGQSGLLVAGWEKGANCINNDKAVWGQTSLQPRPLHPPPPGITNLDAALSHQLAAKLLLVDSMHQESGEASRHSGQILESQASGAANPR